MATCTIFTNAKAGLLAGPANADEMRKLVDSIGIDGEVVATNSEDEMCDSIRRLERDGAERVAVVGGDGTVRAAVQCLAGSKTALGIIPHGTHNNFAHALGLPLDVERALHVLRDGRVIEVDLGRVGDKFFTEAAGVGVFANILDTYGAANKNVWRGLYAILKTFFTLRARRLRLTIDGKVISERAVMCTVANSYRIGMGAPLAPGASVVDGVLDVVVLGDLTRFELIRYYRAVQANTHFALPKVSRLTATTVKIQAARPLPLHIDDQIVGTTPATIEIAPGKLKVIVK
jgi:diacylglycerol kinase (ATP)